MTISVHDNVVYGFSVNCRDRRVVLHTVFTEREPQEFTDIVFSGVVAHSFDYALPVNILFDVQEIDTGAIVDRAAAIFRESWRYLWPEVEYAGDLNVLKEKLRASGLSGFEISSSYGLSGWILAERCERRSRNALAVLS